jgi:transcriptional regulator with XRE-family HTH domain
MYDAKLFGQRLKEERLVRDLTLAEAGSYLKIDQASLCRFESGRKRPSLETLCRICNTLNVSPEKMLRGL